MQGSISISRARSSLTTLVATASLVVLATTPALAARPSAPGNNGTVKVHGGADEASPITGNDPHVCDFHLDFLFADADQSGSWWIESWSPGGDRSVVLSGGYTTDADGYDRQPALGTYELPNGHYKLSWEGAANPGGAVNAKHKVFWVDCAEDDGGNGGGGEEEPPPTQG